MTALPFSISVALLRVALAAAGLGVPLLLAWLAVSAVCSPAAPQADSPAAARAGGAEPEKVRSPIAVAFSPDGRLLAASDRTAGELVIIQPPATQPATPADAEAKVLRRVALAGQPARLAWSEDGKQVYVAETGDGAHPGAVAVVDPHAGHVVRRLKAGPMPTGLALVPSRNLLLVTDAGLGCVVAIDLATGTEKARIAVGAEPVAVAASRCPPAGRWAAVANLLACGDATEATNAATVSLIDLDKLECVREVRLPAGSTNVRDVAFSPDGQWIYAIHTLGRFTLPTSQLERGWVNTNAMSIIRAVPATQPANAAAPPARTPQRGGPSPTPPVPPAPTPADLGTAPYATVLLDLVSEGAADPWGLAVAPDGATAWITLAGVGQLARVDLARLHGLLTGAAARMDESLKKTLTELARYRQAGVQVTWLDIQSDPTKRELLVNDLAALHVAGVLVRTPLAGPAARGPRGIALSADGAQFAVAGYFGGAVQFIDAAGENAGRAAAAVSLGPSPAPDAVRRGEIAFHDATLSFQHWLSCATCHPDGRADGLNWDLLNDGLGNPKNTRSLLVSHLTPPAMALGVRANMEAASRAGFRFILFHEPQGEELEVVQAYIRSLQAAPSPYLVDGKLSERAARGKKLFEDRRTDCSRCHPGPLFTDLKPYDVGTRGRFDKTAVFDNPTLVEMWRSRPFLHDGSARTMMDVLTTHNRNDRHGSTSKLTKDELEDLAAYLLSI